MIFRSVLTRDSGHLLLSEGKQHSLLVRYPLVSVARHFLSVEYPLVYSKAPTAQPDFLCGDLGSNVKNLKKVLQKKLTDMAWWCRAHSTHGEGLSSAPNHHVG